MLAPEWLGIGCGQQIWDAHLPKTLHLGSALHPSRKGGSLSGPIFLGDSPLVITDWTTGKN